MKNLKSFIGFVVVYWLVLLPGTEALFCYKCHDSKTGGSCDDSKQLKTARQQRSGLVHNCTGQQHFCVIESFNTQGRYSSFIRDCSDGHTFSNDVKKVEIINSTLRADNSTVCGYYQAYQVCVNLCTTEFCNGPQFTGSASAVKHLTCLALITFILIIQLLHSD